MIKHLDNLIFVAPSRRENKKYDVYDNNHKYITSFGDVRYAHYKDKIGYYKHLNHHNINRRRLYKLRHANDYINDKTKAGYYAMKYLW